MAQLKAASFKACRRMPLETFASSHSRGRYLKLEYVLQVFNLGASVVAIVCNIGPAGVLLAQWIPPSL